MGLGQKSGCLAGGGTAIFERCPNFVSRAPILLLGKFPNWLKSEKKVDMVVSCAFQKQSGFIKNGAMLAATS